MLKASILSVNAFPFSGDAPPPLIAVNARSVGFPYMVKSNSTSLDITIHNPSMNTLKVHSLSTTTSTFHVKMSVPLIISGNGSAKVHIVFSPIGFGAFNDALRVISNGGNAQIGLNIRPTNAILAQ